MNQKYATVPRDGFEVPLIGIPPEAGQEKCAMCFKVVKLSEAKLFGEVFLCERCLNEVDNK